MFARDERPRGSPAASDAPVTQHGGERRRGSSSAIRHPLPLALPRTDELSLVYFSPPPPPPPPHELFNNIKPVLTPPRHLPTISGLWAAGGVELTQQVKGGVREGGGGGGGCESRAEQKSSPDLTSER